MLRGLNAEREQESIRKRLLQQKVLKLVLPLLASGFLCFLQPCWEGCRIKQNQNAARAECRVLTAECHSQKEIVKSLTAVGSP
jgi:hypothetical protein